MQSPLSSSVPIVNPITITAPNQVAPPIVGSSSAVSVVAPVSSVPVNPIGVKPPSSAVVAASSQSTTGVTIKPLEWVYDSDDNCIDTLVIRSVFFNALRGGREPEACSPEDITEAEERLRLAQKAANGGNFTEAEANKYTNLELNYAKRIARARLGSEAAAAIEVYRVFINIGTFSPNEKVAMTMMLSICVQICLKDDIRSRLIQGAKATHEGSILSYIRQRRDYLQNAPMMSSTPFGYPCIRGKSDDPCSPSTGLATYYFGWVIGLSDYNTPQTLDPIQNFFAVLDLLGFGFLAAQGGKLLLQGLGRGLTRGIGKLVGEGGVFARGGSLSSTRIGRDMQETARRLEAAANSSGGRSQLVTSQQSAPKAGSTQPLYVASGDNAAEIAGYFGSQGGRTVYVADVPTAFMRELEALGFASQRTGLTGSGVTYTEWVISPAGLHYLAPYFKPLP